jgi:tetratricopeptide (TPR) repeat protein
MKRLFYLGLLLLVLAGLGAAYVLIPTDSEMMLVHFRNRDYERARQMCRRLMERGQVPTSLLIPMANLYEHSGDIETAAALMELVVRDHPDQIDVHRRLGRILKAQHRLTDYADNLETICRLQPTEQELLDLCRLLGFLQQWDRQTWALGRLVALCPRRAQEYRELADLQAARGHLSDALATLRRMGASCPDPADMSRLLFEASLLLDLGRPDQALKILERRLADRSSAAELVDIVGLLNRKGRVDLSMRLMEPRLDRLLAAVPGAPVPGAPPSPAKPTSAEPSDPLPEWLLISMAESAEAADRPAFARKVLTVLDRLYPDGDAADRTPGGRALTNRWPVAAAPATPLSTEDRAEMASLWIRIGRLQEAYSLLMTLAPRDDMPEWALDDLSDLCHQLQKTSESVDVFANLRRSRPSPSVDAAWARLAVEAGRDREVLGWLATLPPGLPPEETLDELCDAAGERGQTNLVLAVTERLYRRSPNGARRIQWVEALLGAGRAAEALARAREMPLDGPEAEAVYFDVLAGAGKAGLPIRQLVEDFCVPRLASTNLDEAAREDLLTALVEAGACEAALPVLRSLADARGGRSEEEYEDILRRSGQREILCRRWRERAERPSTSDDARRAIAYQLLEQGDKAGAERILLRLAASEPPGHADVDELIFLWGPRPEAAALDWLLARAQSSTNAADQAQWLRFILDGGAAAKVAAWAQSRPPEEPLAPPVLGVYLESLVALDDVARLAAIIPSGAAQDTDPERLRFIGRAAIEAERFDDAQTAYERLLQRAPGDLDATRNLGRLAYRNYAHDEARKYFAQLGPNDAEAQCCLGEIALRENAAETAAARFRRAEAILPNDPAAPFEQRLLRARALRGLGRNTEALALFAQLAREETDSDEAVQAYEELMHQTNAPAGP